jgi:hypothetical protein
MLMFVSLAGVALLWLAGCCALLAFAYRRAMAARWREPVLGAPVLILESDDWGYGPDGQAGALDRIAETLAAFRDRRGRHPVMTLGVVLAGPDTDRMRAEGCRKYHRVTLADPRLAPVREAMTHGVARGVFSLQLHGMEHFWPDCLMRGAATDGPVRAWLSNPGFSSTEELPSELQSRWIDATGLPSKPLPVAEVVAAAGEESRVFATTFGQPPEVVVPPTFIWTEDVESAWAKAGIRVVVTPGKRCESRDREGRPVPVEPEHCNGATGRHGVLYVVRDNYFEPSLGQTHQGALRALTRNTYLGRPTMLEIHRMNFMGEERPVQHALDEVSSLLAAACAQFPDIRFMNTAELARHYRERSDLFASRVGARVHVLLRRLREVSRLRKLAWATGVVLPAWLAYLATAPWTLRRSRQWQ